MNIGLTIVWYYYHLFCNSLNNKTKNTQHTIHNTTTKLVEKQNKNSNSCSFLLCFCKTYLYLFGKYTKKKKEKKNYYVHIVLRVLMTSKVDTNRLLKTNINKFI